MKRNLYVPLVLGIILVVPAVAALYRSVFGMPTPNMLTIVIMGILGVLLIIGSTDWGKGKK
jgi:hypothetical protein